jgi:hypothetical protein
MPASDAVMAVLDKLPLSMPEDVAPEAAQLDQVGPLPFGLRFAVAPVVPCDKHKEDLLHGDGEGGHAGQPGWQGRNYSGRGAEGAGGLSAETQRASCSAGGHDRGIHTMAWTLGGGREEVE